MKIRIIHLGLGRFHRAHQAVYYQRLLEEFGEEWGVVAFSMRTPEACDNLRAAQHRYPVIELKKIEPHIRWIECIRECHFAIRDRKKLNDFFCSSEVSLVTLTVTEKAYMQDSSDSNSLGAILYEGLRLRRISVNCGLTVLSCDNLRNNGDKLKQVVLNYAKSLSDSETSTWISEHVKFPNSMVDRIVPALAPERLHELQQRFQTENTELVATEVFSQWVIENTFSQPFPSLQKVGVQFVSDVSAFEEVKLRLLNASHSFIAYSGLLKSYTYVHEAIADAEIADQLRDLHDEIIPLLRIPEGFDIQLYRNQMMARFDNPELPHQLRQIAMDGSQKLPQRILPSLQQASKMNLPQKQLLACVQNWVRFCYDNVPDDPLKEKIETIKAKSSDFAHFKKNITAELLFGLF